MKQTAVEWLVNMWEMQGTITPLDIREAKRIEKEQIVKAYIADSVLRLSTKAEQYYNETYIDNK